jgi:serine/threonine protein kinase
VLSEDTQRTFAAPALTTFLSHFQSLIFLLRKGICHRNICLDNLLLDANDNLVLIDSGLALRVPYNDPCNIDAVTDASEGSIRRLMKPQGQCGKLMYLAPEMLENKPFDGHATDLWAAGITLFIMLVGVAPFSMAQLSDKRFETISRGGLKYFLESVDVRLSPEAVDLLQGMFREKPQERLSLADVMRHPWVLGHCFPIERRDTPSTAVTYDTCSDAEDITESNHEAAEEGSETCTTELSDVCVLEENSCSAIVTPPQKRRVSVKMGLMGKFRHMIQKKRSSSDPELPKLTNNKRTSGSPPSQQPNMPHDRQEQGSCSPTQRVEVEA